MYNSSAFVRLPMLSDMQTFPVRTWTLRRERWTLPAEGAVMGILNATPDSFSDGGLFYNLDAAVQRACDMVREGADMIDIGGESTRPGAEEVDTEEEKRRVIPLLCALRQEFPKLRLSIDTRHVAVAAAALEAGADILNDITALADPAMRELCAAQPCGIILMHMQGEPRTMQDCPMYGNVLAEVHDFFESRVRLAEQAGIEASRLCLDPGIGFGKNVEHNVSLIARTEEVRVRNLPLMMALSRKRFMGELLHDPSAPKVSSLPTVVMSLMAADSGADLHRVHDVAALRQALRLRHHVRQAMSHDAGMR